MSSTGRRLDSSDVNKLLAELPESDREARKLQFERGYTQKLLAIEALRLVVDLAQDNTTVPGVPDHHYDSRGYVITVTPKAMRDLWEAAGGRGSEAWGEWVRTRPRIDNRDYKGERNDE